MQRVDLLEKTDAGRDWGQEEKGTTEDEMAGWHHWLDGRESEWTPGVGDGQRGLVCCDSWGRKESDTTERLNWTELKNIGVCVSFQISAFVFFKYIPRSGVSGSYGIFCLFFAVTHGLWDLSSLIQDWTEAWQWKQQLLTTEPLRNYLAFIIVFNLLAKNSGKVYPCIIDITLSGIGSLWRSLSLNIVPWPSSASRFTEHLSRTEQEYERSNNQ